MKTLVEFGVIGGKEFMSRRIGFIDIAKALSIILVALAHSPIRKMFPQIIDSMSLFRMPLFFFLSGLFFSDSDNSSKFLWKKFDSLLKPYFTTLIIVTFIMLLVQEKKSFLPEFAGILYGNGNTIEWVPLWFLSHLFAVHCFVYFIYKFTSFKNFSLINKLLMLTVMFIVGIFSIDVFNFAEIELWGRSFTLPGLPFSLDLLLISSTYYIFGTILKDRIINFKPNNYLLGFSFLIFMIIIIFSNAYINLNSRIYANPLFTSIGTICGIYLMLSLSIFLDKINFGRSFLLYIGTSALFVLIFHKHIEHKIFIHLTGMTSNEYPLITSIFAFILSILIPLGIKEIIIRSKILSKFYIPIKPDQSGFNLMKKGQIFINHFVKR